MKTRKLILLFSLFLFIHVILSCKGGGSTNLSQSSDSLSVDSQYTDMLHIDTIRRVRVSAWYVTGIRVYKAKDGEQPPGDIYLCLLNKEGGDSLIVFANTTSKQFTLGGPWGQTKDSVLRAKFSKYDNVEIYQDTMYTEPDYGPPYEFFVIIGRDSLDYMSNFTKENYYGFQTAILCESRFSFGEYKVGKNINNCTLGKLIPKEMFSNLKIIRMLPCCSYKLPFNKKFRDEGSWGITLKMDKGIIKMMDNAIDQ